MSVRAASFDISVNQTGATLTVKVINQKGFSGKDACGQSLCTLRNGGVNGAEVAGETHKSWSAGPGFKSQYVVTLPSSGGPYYPRVAAYRKTDTSEIYHA